MPTLGLKIYDQLKGKKTSAQLGKAPRLNDEDSQKLRESLNAMALFFKQMSEASRGENRDLFDNACQFCKDMASADPKKGKKDDCSKFDDAWKFIFPDDDPNYSQFDYTFEPVRQFARNKVPVYPSNQSDVDRIHCNQSIYDRQRTEHLAVIKAGNNLINGISGLQTYVDNHSYAGKIDKDLNGKIEHVEEEFINKSQKELNDSRDRYLESLKEALENSHRFLGNSDEYGDMLKKAQNLYDWWKSSSDDERRMRVRDAKEAAEKYIRLKRGSHNENDWNPITKEGKKRRALAICLRKTVTDLLKEELKEDDLLEEDDLLKEAQTNPNNNKFETNKKIILENNIIEKGIIDNKEITTSTKAKKSKSPTHGNDIHTKARAKVMITNTSSDLRAIRINMRAQTLISDYYRDAGRNANKIVAKAVAVNVLRQLGIDGFFGSKSTPDGIFSPENINKVTAAVEKSSLFNNNKLSYEQKIFKNKGFKLMDKKDIEPLIVNIGALNLIGVPKEGPAEITSNQPKQGMDANGTKPIGKGKGK